MDVSQFSKNYFDKIHNLDFYLETNQNNIDHSKRQLFEKSNFSILDFLQIYFTSNISIFELNS